MALYARTMGQPMKELCHVQIWSPDRICVFFSNIENSSSFLKGDGKIVDEDEHMQANSERTITTATMNMIIVSLYVYQ